ncbi:Exostosin-3 [Nymphon striatum]|nr:Exostosin-3 [Nymphon striatum]
MTGIVGLLLGGQRSFWETVYVRLSNVRIIHAVLILVLLMISVSSFAYVLIMQEVETDSSDALFQSKYASKSLGSLKGVELKNRINELIAIKASVRDELRTMESRRSVLQAEITEYTQKVETLKTTVMKQQQNLDRLNLAIQQAKFMENELREQNTPEIKAPLPILPGVKDNVKHSNLNTKEISSCHIHKCFDHSRCSITSQFPVYVYSSDDFGIATSFNALKTVIMEAMQQNIHLTYNPTIACIYLVVISDGISSSSSIEKILYRLPYWNDDGRNHVILNLNAQLQISHHDLLNVNTGKAIIVQSSFTFQSFRSGFDIVGPPLVNSDPVVWKALPALSPAKREIFLSFQGFHKESDNDEIHSQDNPVIEILKSFGKLKMGDAFRFNFECQQTSNFTTYPSDWLICSNTEDRTTMLIKSTFSLILMPSNEDIISTNHVLVRLLESLKFGAIPVILGGDRVVLPFQEFIDWKKAALLLPKSRVTEVHFTLRAMQDSDILYMRRQGRYIWQTYFASPGHILSSILACLRMRLGIPPPPLTSEPSPRAFFTNNQTTAVNHNLDEDSGEILGPVEPPFPSLSYQRNYSLLSINAHDLWNKYMDPFNLYPSLPYDPILPSEAKHIGSSKGFRPINKGEGGAGKEFSQALGGNYPREQFTIVMLTYERENILIDALEKFNNLPNLNKVVVVWNSANPPSESFKWPQIHVPIHVRVVKPKKNSLNNRFLPYEAIETDAILSIDDDAHLRHDEITFGFRVWREGRDRIVGFPGRFHAWDVNNGGWLYNSNYSCELSMVLTGAAFYHKYYAYQYSYFMPQTIRDKVDEYMNCEDIAINFLVSHITRKPPLKVTSRWTFRCPGCPIALSEDDSHFQERHKCMKFFSEVYGYNPLLNTQFRVDSVLFKTRLPQDKQKCFKYI